MRRIAAGWDRLLQDLPRTAAAAVCAAVFLAVLAYAFGSDIREPACNRLQDDSYYYLQPAWNFSRGGVFTFDGENPTYGFQPLWMIVLAALARLSPDKLFFLRAAVALGGLFFCLTGWMLFLLARQWLKGWPAVLAPLLWTANFSLLGAFITGKENALFAFLLVFACHRILRIAERPPRVAWREGIVLGLLVLSRINALIPALILLAVAWWQGAGTGRERFRRMLSAGAAMGAVLAVWCLYAQLSFGAVFPNSGTAKLFGARAALALFLESRIPWIPPAWIETIVPQAERILLERPDLLILPTKEAALSYLTGLLPDLAFGSWTGIFPFLGRMDYRIKVLALAALGIGAAAWVLLKLRSPSRAAGAVVGVLLLSAAANFLANWLLMPEYLLWGIWYAVPETLAMIVGAVCLAGWPYEGIAGAKGSGAKYVRAAYATAAALLMAAGLIRVWSDLLPREYSAAPDGSQQAAYDAAGWMNANLPPGTRVGSFSAGLIGYFGETYRVINLDGLANTPQFAAKELVGHLLFVRGLADIDPLREYLAREKIFFLANFDTAERIAAGDYLGLVGAGDGVLLYRGEKAILWGPGEPERRMIVVRIGEE
ncbi:MAG: hypothetical protein JW929_06270 [Anaerolineales bacterium]|nr:hypothetical protein [Anaerolineales bacterium]